MWKETSKQLPEQNQLVIVQDQWLNIHVCIFKKIKRKLCGCEFCDCLLKDVYLFVEVDDVRSYSLENYDIEDKDWESVDYSIDSAYIDLWTEFPCIQPIKKTC